MSAVIREIGRFLLCLGVLAYLGIMLFLIQAIADGCSEAQDATPSTSGQYTPRPGTPNAPAAAAPRTVARKTEAPGGSVR